MTDIVARIRQVVHAAAGGRRRQARVAAGKRPSTARRLEFLLLEARLAPANFGNAITIPGGLNETAAAVGDFNYDGHSDIAVLNSTYHGGFTVVTGDGQGNFKPYATVTVAGSANPVAFAVGDFNNDGIADVVLAEANAGPAADTSLVQTFLGDGKGGFHLAASVTLGTNNQDLPAQNGLVVGDFNGDGRLDVALAVRSSQSSFGADRQGPRSIRIAARSSGRRIRASHADRTPSPSRSRIAGPCR